MTGGFFFTGDTVDTRHYLELREAGMSTLKTLLLTSLLLMGCKSSVEPVRGDVYILESISGIPLPAPWTPNPELNLRIIADTIAFTTETTGERRTLLEASAAGETRLARATFTYTSDGDRVAISHPCPPNASCIAPPHLIGTLTSASFVVTTSKISRQPLVFRRLFPPD